MKNYKLFQICYTLNFISCLSVLGIAFYQFIINYENLDNFNLYFFLFCLVITVVFSTFDWLCYQLAHFIKIRNLLPPRLRITGVIFNITCCLITTLSILGFITIRPDISQKGRQLYHIDR